MNERRLGARMKKWIFALVAAALAANYLLVIVAAVGVISVIIVIFRLLALLG